MKIHTCREVNNPGEAEECVCRGKKKKKKKKEKKMVPSHDGSIMVDRSAVSVDAGKSELLCGLRWVSDTVFGPRRDIKENYIVGQITVSLP